MSRIGAPPVPTASGARDLEGLLQALIGIGMGEKYGQDDSGSTPDPSPFQKEEERHLADLRDKRDKAKRAVDHLLEDALRKEEVYREAAAKVNTQREECDELERQGFPSLPNDGVDTDPCLASEVLGGSEDEAQRDCETGLGTDVDAQRLARKRTPRLRLELKPWVLRSWSS